MTIKAGYLPLYIKLYDEENPHMRDPMVAHMEKLIKALRDRGLEIVPANVCRTKDEFDEAVALFEKEHVTVVITHHLAYSPSLESIDALLRIKVPIVVFDTTPNLSFAGEQDSRDLINDNHGIHGVQDMCSMLRRNGRSYSLAVGHVQNSDVLDEVTGYCRAAAVAEAFKTSRVGSVGGSFEGMGDFLISEQELKDRIGAETFTLSREEGKALEKAVTEEEIDREIAYDKEAFTVEINDEKAYRDSLRSCLALRKWIAEKSLDAVTVNFTKLDESGLTTMPFTEASKAMARAIGYAGEGDKLTAALVGALMKVYGTRAGFLEMFCPDWVEDLIFISHMGEANIAHAAWKPVLCDVNFPYNSYGKTTGAFFGLKPGHVSIVNLAVTPGKMTMVLAEGDLVARGHENNIYRKAMQGWLAPSKPVKEFLKTYSEFGGTHHSAFVYDVSIEELAAFGNMMGFDVKIVK